MTIETPNGASMHLSYGVRRFSRGQGPQFRFWPHFWKSLAAIVAGNAVYFLVLAPRLPAVARHEPGRLDLGLVIDFWMCLVCFGILTLLKFIGHPGEYRR